MLVFLFRLAFSPSLPHHYIFHLCTHIRTSRPLVMVVHHCHDQVLTVSLKWCTASSPIYPFAMSWTPYGRTFLIVFWNPWYIGVLLAVLSPTPICSLLPVLIFIWFFRDVLVPPGLLFWTVVWVCTTTRISVYLSCTSCVFFFVIIKFC